MTDNEKLIFEQLSKITERINRIQNQKLNIRVGNLELDVQALESKLKEYEKKS